MADFNFIGSSDEPFEGLNMMPDHLDAQLLPEIQENSLQLANVVDSQLTPSQVLSIHNKLKPKDQDKQVNPFNSRSDYLNFVYHIYQGPYHAELIDSQFQGGIEIDMKSAHLLIDTFVQNKNKGIIFMIYPRFLFYRQFWGKPNQDSGKFRFEVGASVGEQNRRITTGVTHMLSKWSQIGYRRQICPSHGRTVNQLLYTHQITDQTFIQTKVQRDNILKKTDIISQILVSFKINKKIKKPNESKNISPKKQSWELVLTEKKAQLKYKHTTVFSKNLELKRDIQVERDSIDDETIGIMASSNLLLRARFSNHLKLYGGVMFNMDGWTFLFGFKLAGVKLLIPWTGLEQMFQRQSKQQQEEPLIPVINHLAINFVFVGISFFLSKRAKEQKSLDIKNWIEKEASDQYRKHLACVQMILARSIENQNSSCVKVLAAYYGIKERVKEYINFKLSNNEELADDGSIPNMPFKNAPKFVLNVTIPCRFILTQQSLSIQTKSTKADIVGFFKPIPDFMDEEVVLCIIYKIDDETTIQYFRDDAPLIQLPN